MLALLLGVVSAALVAVVVIAGGRMLPELLGTGTSGSKTITFHVLSWSVVAFGLATLAVVVVAARHGSQLRLWLVPVVLLTTFEAVQLPSSGRYKIGWYAPRLLGMLATTILLVALLVQVWRQAKALAAARAQSDRLAQIVQQSPAGYVLVDRRGIVVDVNQAFCDITGLARDDLVGSPANHPFGARDDPVADIGSLLVGQARSLTLRQRATRPDGSSVWLDVVAHLMTDAAGQPAGLAATVTDVSGEVAADLDPHAPVGMAVVTAAGVITRASQSLCAMVGRDRADLVGAPFADLVASPDRADDDREMDLMRRGEAEVAGSEVRLVRAGADASAGADAGGFWTALYRSALRDARGTLVGVAVQVIDIDDRKRAEAAAREARVFLEHRSTYDDLTGLLNRPAFVDRLQAMLDADTTMAVLIIDIDRFRRFSNSMPRHEADQIISESARRLAVAFERDGLVARVGGDEFAIAVPVADDGAVAAPQVAVRARDVVGTEPTGPAGRRRLLTCCVGVTVGEPGDAAADLLQQADLATRAAKESGPGRWRLFDRRMREVLLARLEMVDRIRAGLAAEQFVAWYQPIVTLGDRRLVGYEALSRWISADGTIVPPDAYFPVAEDSGLVVPIGARTLDAAVGLLARVPEPLTVAVNASPTELLTGDFATEVARALQRHRAPARRLHVEITEQALFDVRRTEDAGVTRLAALGVGIYVDDFGTGYSSITHLRDFPVHGIKLDRSFTAQLDDDSPRAMEISATLADLAARLGLDSVAEGVETAAQAERLAGLGWRHGQGWLFGRPAPEGDALGHVGAGTGAGLP